MPTLIKRLASNELGHTGGHQRGGILIPKNCINFFPTLGPPPNPETRISASFDALNRPVDLRIIYYEQGTRNEYRMTPVPHQVLRNARAGDYFLLRENPDGTYTGAVARAGDPLHTIIQTSIGNRVGQITPADYLPP